MSNQQLMLKGRKEISATDAALGRAERVAEETLQIGTSVSLKPWMIQTLLTICGSIMPALPALLCAQAAEGLDQQTKQLNALVDKLNDMEFNLKKATKIIADITRGLLTDKWVQRGAR